MSEEIPGNPPLNPQNQREEVSTNFRSLISSLWAFLGTMMNIREGTDFLGTIEGIKKDIDFKGHNVWILICSIFIASIGLNMNSTAVIVGAMLISPLMGPILGIGLSVGTNDLDTLFRSLRSFGVAIAVSLVTATAYFLITPIHEMQPELISRTKPTILDIFIAIFGGIAGIIAGSRKEKSNVVPGVAIATALMPPLCTAGYGLASANWNFFFGAFYLFILNSVFICGATVVFVRYLRFPLVQFLDPIIEKRVKRYIIIFVLVVIIPSGFIFWDVIKESYFKNSAENFITHEVHFEGSEVINKKLTYTDTLSTIELFLIGEIVSDEVERDLNRRLSNYDLDDNLFVKKTILYIHQAKDASLEIEGKVAERVRTGIIEDIYKEKEGQLRDREQKIEFLENKLLEYKESEFPFSRIEQELQVQYPELERFAFARAIGSDFNSASDTIPTFLLKWSGKVNTDEELKLQNWLKVRLNLDTVQIVGY